jgi:hypothetical protein
VSTKTVPDPGRRNTNQISMPSRCSPAGSNQLRQDREKRPRGDVSCGSMLSKKSFLADERNFSAPQVRHVRGNARDHIESQKNDHRPSHMPCRGLQRPRQLKTDLREIFGAAQFSTFSTASVKLRRTQYEHMFSASRSNPDIAMMSALRICGKGRNGFCYSITSSAWARSVCGMARPRFVAVLRLMTS